MSSSQLPGQPAKQLALQQAFLKILPRIHSHARIAFCREPCHHRQADCVAEVVAICWKWFVRLEERGKDATQWVSVLAEFAVRAVRSGRRLCRRLSVIDILSETAQRRHGFTVGKLPDFSTLNTNPLIEALHDNTQTEVPEQVAFRCDHRAWVRRLTRRDRRLVRAMMLGHATKDLAGLFHVSPSRISQKRREFHDSWRRFCGDPLHRC